MSGITGISKGVKLRKFEGFNIPIKSTKAVLGTYHGVYFYWKKAWHFMAIDGYVIKAPNFDSKHHTGHKIKELKKCAK